MCEITWLHINWKNCLGRSSNFGVGIAKAWTVKWYLLCLTLILLVVWYVYIVNCILEIDISNKFSLSLSSVLICRLTLPELVLDQKFKYGCVLVVILCVFSVLTLLGQLYIMNCGQDMLKSIFQICMCFIVFLIWFYIT